MLGDATPLWVKEPLPEQTYRIYHRRSGQVPPCGNSAERIRKSGPPLLPHQPPAVIAGFGERRTGEPSQRERTSELVGRQDGLTFLGGEWPLIQSTEHREMGDRVLPGILQCPDDRAKVGASIYSHDPLADPPRLTVRPTTSADIVEIDPPHQHGGHSRLGAAHRAAVHPPRCRVGTRT